MILVSCSSGTWNIDLIEESSLRDRGKEVEVHKVSSFKEFHYIPFELREREHEGISDDYVLMSDWWYNCENISELMRFSLTFDISQEFCGQKEYLGNTIIYFVHYNPPYETLPTLWYKIYVFDADKGYFNYIYTLYEDEDGYIDLNQEFFSGFEYISVENKRGLSKISWWEPFWFPSEKYWESYEYLDESLKKDIEKEALWIRKNFQRVEAFVEDTFTVN